MSRHEADREDLMKEATALMRRVECLIPNEPEPVFAGYRRNGFLSIYFGPDPVYHFDDECRLRSVFADGLLYRSQGTTLARLERERTADESILRRHDLTPQELENFLTSMTNRLSVFADALQNHDFQIVSQIPQQATLIDDLSTSLANILRGRVILSSSINRQR
jgi:predicted DCC family thiol-disulfide oxidoreductase YuxK